MNYGRHSAFVYAAFHEIPVEAQPILGRPNHDMGSPLNIFLTPRACLYTLCIRSREFLVCLKIAVVLAEQTSFVVSDGATYHFDINGLSEEAPCHIEYFAAQTHSRVLFYDRRTLPRLPDLRSSSQK